MKSIHAGGEAATASDRSHGVVIVGITSDLIGVLDSCDAIVSTSIPVDLSRGGATIGGTGAGARSGFDGGGDGSDFDGVCYVGFDEDGAGSGFLQWKAIRIY